MRKITIILDAAHGSNTPGKQSPDGSTREFQWSRYFISILKPMLEQEGYVVRETNPTDLEIGLSKRVKITNAFTDPNKVFFSPHNNAAGADGKWHEAHGFSFYTTKGQTKSDPIAEIMYKEVEKAFPGFVVRKDTRDGDSDIEANFAVLMCKCPAVLMEWQFQDDHEGVAIIKDKKMNERLAIALVQAFNKINDLY